MIEARYKLDNERNSTLQKLVQAEKEDGIKGNATQGMMWFKRFGLFYTLKS